MSDGIKVNKKKIIAGLVFLLLGLYMASIVPSVEMAWVMGLLILTIYMFAFEVVDVDVTAISIMVLLGLSTLFAPIMGLQEGMVSPDLIFKGFSSNAVMSIIAIMIIGAGLDKTGIMTKVASFILKAGGTSEKRIIPIVSSTVGIISSLYAERRCCGTIYSGSEQDFSSLRTANVPLINAYGLLCNFRWYGHHGRFFTADPVKRSDLNV